MGSKRYNSPVWRKHSEKQIREFLLDGGHAEDGSDMGDPLNLETYYCYSCGANTQVHERSFPVRCRKCGKEL